MTVEQSQENAIVAIFDTHHAAEDAVKELQQSGFDMKKLSIVGKGYYTEEHPVGFYTTGDRIKYWGGNGALWGGLWGMLFGAAFFWVPGVGPLAIGGPLVALLVGALEGAAIVGGISALGAALASIGMSKDSIIRFETAIKADKFVIIAHGAAGEVTKARQIIERARASSVEVLSNAA
ncbi:MAG: DUF1269 domain-containing protein [Hyphomicrobiaceae bacterium]|nr:DUF1269 domain-containing protein [Hyphomicrobiaceae bacterium]